MPTEYEYQIHSRYDVEKWKAVAGAPIFSLSPSDLGSPSPVFLVVFPFVNSIDPVKISISATESEVGFDYSQFAKWPHR